jgi:hypothetical protein
MDTEATNNAVDMVCDTIVGDIWFELSDALVDNADDDGRIHKALVSLVRKAVRKGIDIGRQA